MDSNQKFFRHKTGSRQCLSNKQNKAYSAYTSEKSTWFLDSGCNNSIASEDVLIKKVQKQNLIKSMTGAVTHAKEEGTLNLGFGELSNVIFSKDLTNNLLSVSDLASKGFSTLFDNSGVYVIDSPISVTH